METFTVGSHVVIELMDDRKIAGYIQGYTEDGMVLSATHKDAVLTRRLSETMKADIQVQLQGKNVAWLKGAMLLRGHFGGLLASRADMIDQLAADIEADILDQSEDGMQFRELSSPVLTFISGGAIMLMEDTNDKMQEVEVSIFDQTLDAALKQILDGGDDETEEEKNVEAEELSEGNQGTTGPGTDGEAAQA
jgi:hypothetical protein